MRKDEKYEDERKSTQAVSDSGHECW